MFVIDPTNVDVVLVFPDVVAGFALRSGAGRAAGVAFQEPQAAGSMPAGRIEDQRRTLGLTPR